MPVWFTYDLCRLFMSLHAYKHQLVKLLKIITWASLLQLTYHFHCRLLTLFVALWNSKKRILIDIDCENIPETLYRNHRMQDETNNFKRTFRDDCPITGLQLTTWYSVVYISIHKYYDPSRLYAEKNTADCAWHSTISPAGSSGAQLA